MHQLVGYHPALQLPDRFRAFFCEGIKIGRVYIRVAGETKCVVAPLIGECFASFECRLHDDVLVRRYNVFIFEVVKAHVAPRPKYPQTLHYTGDGVFMVAGRIVSRRSLFRPGML